MRLRLPLMMLLLPMLLLLMLHVVVVTVVFLWRTARRVIICRGGDIILMHRESGTRRMLLVSIGVAVGKGGPRGKRRRLLLQVTAALATASCSEHSVVVMNTVLIESGVLRLLLMRLICPLVRKVGMLLVRRNVMLASAAVTLDRGGRVAVDGVLEALARPVKVVLRHLIHTADAAAATVASAAVWLIHHPDATGVMLPLPLAAVALLPFSGDGGCARVDLPQSSVKLQFRCKPERGERKKRLRWVDRRREWRKEITVKSGEGSGIIGIDNPHNVSVSRVNARFPICVVSPRGRKEGREREKRRSHPAAQLGSLSLPPSLSILLTVNFSARRRRPTASACVPR